MAKTLSILIMDPPFESANSTTAFRMVESALRKGHNVNVFAYEGAVGLSFAKQEPHPNKVKGTSVEDEEHPLPKDMVSGLFSLVKEGQTLNWVNCGLCVDERGVGESVEGPVRGTPGDFIKSVGESNNTIVIPAK